MLHVCRAYFALRMADQWLSWRLDMIASFLILIVALLAISQRDHINPSLTAVSLTQVLRCCWHSSNDPATAVCRPCTQAHGPP